MTVVRSKKCAFEIEIAKDDVLFVCVSIFHTKAEMGDRLWARAVGPKSFLFRADDLASLDVVHG